VKGNARHRTAREISGEFDGPAPDPAASRRRLRVHHGPMKTALQAQIEDLFSRHPALCGFSVRGVDELPDHCPRGEEHDGELFVDDVGVLPVLGREQLGEILQEIVAVLAEFIADEPGAGEALRGRTFARVLH